jgi:hypothetical protein
MSDLKTCIAAAKADMWADPSSADDLETLGIMVSNCCDWELDGIAKVLYAALEDSNYHTLNERIEKVVADYLKELDNVIPNI